VLQAQGAAKRGGGVGTITRRGGRWLEALLAVAAVLVIVAVMALMTRGMVAPADTGGGGHRTPRRASWARP
jgi:Spy/CpxP family protein refolding chaperone